VGIAGLTLSPHGAAPAVSATYTIYPTAATTTATATTPSATPSVSPTLEFTALVHHVKASVVLITTYKDDLKLGLGSGFFVAPNEIITNCHVIEQANRAEAKTLDGDVLKVELVDSANTDRDVVRLRVQSPSHTPDILPLAKDEPSDGERIVVVGNPLGLEQTVSDGIVASVRDLSPFGRVIQITAPISPGNSGGPVVNMKGEVVGVVRMQSVRGQNLNFAVPAKAVADLPNEKSRTLAEYNGGGRQTVMRSAAVDALQLYITALDGRNYRTAWGLLSNDSQHFMMRTVAKAFNSSDDAARQFLEGSGGSQSFEAFWDRFRSSSHVDSLREARYTPMSETSDLAIVEVNKRSWVLVKEQGQWKVGLVETESYSKAHDSE
jgi:S1-C subfamily serine protease